MKDNEKDTEEELNTSEEDGGLHGTKNTRADADAAPESDELMDDLESRLNELFAADYDDESSDAKTNPIAAASGEAAGSSPIPQKAAAAGTKGGAKIGKRGGAISAAPPADPAPRSDSTAAPPRKSVTPPVAGKEADPNENAAGVEIAAKKPDADAEAESKAPVSEKPQSASRSRESRQVQPAALANVEAETAVPTRRSPEKADWKPGSTRPRASVAVLGGVVLVGAVIALLLILQSPGPSEQDQAQAVPAAHKITKRPARPAASNPTDVSVATAAKVSGDGRTGSKSSPAPIDGKAPAAAPVSKIEIAAVGQDAATPIGPEPATGVSDGKAPVSTPGPKNIPAEARQHPTEAAALKSAYPYSIHASSYRTLAPAREDVETFRKMGLQAYWVPADLGKVGFWYRVFIGHYPDAESAEKVIKSKKLNDAIAKETQYANLIGTYPSEESLRDERKLLLKKGFSPYVVEHQGRRRLYVGAYDTLQNAEKMSAELSAGGIHSQVVRR